VLGGQGGEERMRGVLGIRCAAEQYRHVPVPEPVGADPVAGTRRRGLRHPDQFQVREQVVEVGAGEGGEPGRGTGAGAERRRPVQYRLLQFPLPGVEQRHREPGLVAEAAGQQPPSAARRR